ncbi:uncharacterized protein [Temnothorax longispinosus]|uniref:uncharacterized protein n=1 Tax=Temnothorax longispinosus TaxID=300112 RepID=UPI003A98FB6A
MKMLVKFSKNLNATLYSDFEEKGKGKRLRKPIKYFDDKSDNNKKKNNTKRRNIQSIPPLPKLANASNSAQASEPVKVNKMIKSSCVDKASSSDNNVKSQNSYVTHEINVSHERSKNKNYMDCKEVKLLQETSCSTEMRKSAATTSDKKLSSQKCSSSDKGSTIDPKCTSAKEGKESATLESLADAISNLKGMLKILLSFIGPLDSHFIESWLQCQIRVERSHSLLHYLGFATIRLRFLLSINTRVAYELRGSLSSRPEQAKRSRPELRTFPRGILRREKR